MGTDTGQKIEKCQLKVRWGQLVKDFCISSENIKAYFREIINRASRSIVYRRNGKGGIKEAEEFATDEFMDNETCYWDRCYRRVTSLF